VAVRAPLALGRTREPTTAIGPATRALAAGGTGPCYDSGVPCRIAVMRKVFPMRAHTLLALPVAATLLLLSPMPARDGAAAATLGRPSIAPTLFSKGPELYISPNTGPAGARLAVIGLGYHPRTCLAIEVMPPRSDAGGAPTTLCGPGQVLVDATGRFRTSVTIPTSLRLATAAPDQPLVVMTYNDAATSEATTYKASSIFLLTL
jgi:hypothetical protein